MIEVNSGESKLVSVVIPSYNHAGFVGEAIESVLRQTYRNFEIIVVDDGSSDNSLEVLGRYPGVHCISQENQGVAAARNRGLRESRGEYVVFLDCDDRLLPEAIEAGVNCLNEHPESGFVAGRSYRIAPDGSPLQLPRTSSAEKDFYLKLLVHRGPRCPAAVMFRRAILESVGAFNGSASIRGADDYDLYLRIARKFPAYDHGRTVAEHRAHNTNVSNNYALMLRSIVTVYRSQWNYVKENKKEYEKAYREGLRALREHWGTALVNEGIRKRPGIKGVKHTMAALLILVRYHPRGFITLMRRALMYRVRKVSQSRTGPKSDRMTQTNL